MRFHIIITIYLVLIYLNCQSPQGQNSNNLQQPLDPDVRYEVVPPPVPDEDILNENGELVQITVNDKEFFQKPSKDPLEYFRVFISHQEYLVRQIRGTKQIQRKPDPEGDKLIKEELENYNIINLLDDGIILVSLNSNTGNMELVNFDKRVPRINEIAKIIQNDTMRWKLEHNWVDDKPQVKTFKVYYQIELKQLMSREEIKERFLKKKNKN